MPTQLSIYNDCLSILGTRTLATLSDNVEPRRVLDVLWTGARDWALQQGHWKFAQRVVKIDYNVSITPAFGYNRAFTKPSDFIRTSKVCYDEFLKIPIVDYSEEKGSFYAEIDEIYLQYVSNDSDYGYNFSAWPETFSYFCSAYLAMRSRRRIMPSRSAEEVKAEFEEAESNALFKDSVESPTQYLPSGKWVQSRYRGNSGSRAHERSTLGVGY